MERALGALRAAAGGPAPEGGWSAGDLVAGDRERTLAFLWHAFLAHQLPRLLALRTLRAEVARLEARGRNPNPNRGPAPAHGAGADGLERSEHLALLLRWARAVCARGGCRVRSFATCFAEGRALCLLVSFYLPWSLPAARIHRGAEGSEGGLGIGFGADPEAGDLEGPHLERSAWRSVVGAADGGAAAAARQRAGVARNFALVDAAMARLGGVPPLISAADCCEQGGPAEQVPGGLRALNKQTGLQSKLSLPVRKSCTYIRRGIDPAPDVTMAQQALGLGLC